MIPLFVIATLRQAFATAFVLFVSAGITDAVDGYLARRLDQRSKIGALLDPAVDKLMMFAGYAVYTWSAVVRQRLPFWLTFTVFMRDFVIVVFAYLLYTRIRIRRFPPSVAGKVSTILQVVSLAAVIGANAVTVKGVAPLLGVLFMLTLLATLYSGFDYLRRGDEQVSQYGR